jgi:hypothetical protein
MKGEREDEVELIGTEVNFTLFRNVETGAVVELVDTEDVPGLAGSRGYAAMRLCAMHHGSMRLCFYASVSLVLGNHSGWGYGAMCLGIYVSAHLCVCISVCMPLCGMPQCGMPLCGMPRCVYASMHPCVACPPQSFCT